MKYSRQLIRTAGTAALVACAALGYAQPMQQPQQVPLGQQQEQADPPGRVGSLSQIEGTVAFAPDGETEWADAPLNRPVTAGDRLWADRGSRAEIHLGSSVLHMDGETFLDIADLDDDVMQASLNDGTVNARVRELQPGENFEIDTPQLAFRATQPGDYRIDVDARQGITTVVVRSGAALVFGAGGQPRHLQAGERVAFTGQNLDVAPLPAVADNGFDRWAQDRNRAEDQSTTARYVPRDVVGYQQLDTYGSWDQSADYGPVWYPRVTVADWAPYRYGHWDFIAPWGWTWVDDAPWGFAPFHYGRWAQIGTRWAWVPGRLGPRPVYAPALVAFVGGNGFGSGIGWFPLGPGELWRPTYRTSTRYLGNLNRYVGRGGGRYPSTYIHQQRPGAWTSVRVEDFNRGRPVNRNWQPVRSGDIGRAQILNQPSALPQPRRFVENNGAARVRALPPPQLNAPGFVGRPSRPAFQGQGAPRPPMAETRESRETRPQAPPVMREQQVQIQQQRQQQMQVQRENAQRQQQQQQRQQVQEQRQEQRVERQREHDAGAARRVQPMQPPQVQQQPQRVAPPPPVQVQPQARPEGPGGGRPSIEPRGERGGERGGQGGDDQGQGRGRGNRGG